MICVHARGKSSRCLAQNGDPRGCGQNVCPREETSLATKRQDTYARPPATALVKPQGPVTTVEDGRAIPLKKGFATTGESVEMDVDVCAEAVHGD